MISARTGLKEAKLRMLLLKLSRVTQEHTSRLKTTLMLESLKIEAKNKLGFSTHQLPYIGFFVSFGCLAIAPPHIFLFYVVLNSNPLIQDSLSYSPEVDFIPKVQSERAVGALTSQIPDRFLSDRWRFQLINKRNCQRPIWRNGDNDTNSG